MNGGAMHQRVAVIVAVEAAENLFVGDRHRMADVAAGQRLAEHKNVRQDQVGHKAIAVRPKPVATSSKISSTPYSSHSSRARFKTKCRTFSCHRRPAAAARR